MKPHKISRLSVIVIRHARNYGVFRPVDIDTTAETEGLSRKGVWNAIHRLESQGVLVKVPRIAVTDGGTFYGLSVELLATVPTIYWVRWSPAAKSALLIMLATWLQSRGLIKV